MTWLLLLSMPIDVPATVRARPDFCGAIGRAVEVMATLNGNRLTRGDTITLTVTIAGVDNPQDVKRPSLTPWLRYTQIESDSASIEADRASFRYRLRPRGESKDWPRIKIESFHPGAAEGKQVRTHYFEIPQWSFRESTETSSPAEIPERYRLPMPSVSDRPLYWGWLVVVPLTVIAIPIVSRFRDYWNQRTQSIRRDQGRRGFEKALEASDPVSAVMTLLEESGVDPSPLIPLGDRIRFAPGPVSMMEFRKQAERMLSP